MHFSPNHSHPILLLPSSASETRSMTQADRKRLTAMEMWIWKRMKKISWMDKMINEEVIQRVNETKTSFFSDCRYIP